jgi:hypothetical protein
LVQGEVAINITDKKVWVGDAATTPIQLLGGGSSGTFANLSVTSVATFGAGTVSAPSITTTGDTNTGIFFPAADTIAFTEGGVEAMRIDSSGNVGIGVTPSAWNVLPALQISSYGSICSGGGYTHFSSNAYLSTYPTTWKYVNSLPASRYEMLDGVHIWYGAASGTAGNTISWSERMRITSGCELLVGKTSTSVSTGDGYIFNPNGESYTSVPTSSATHHVYDLSASAYRFYVTSAGTVFATNTTISAISDQRLKENIQDIDVGLEKILALKPRKFDWKAGKGKDKKGDRGWIAQEFEQVFPEMIDTWKDPAPEGEEPYKSVSADLIPVLVKAVQELKAIVDAQAAEIALLKSK